MKLTILAIIVAGATAFAVQAPSTQNTEPIKVRACLQGNGSAESPWLLRGAVLPAPPGAGPAAAPGGGPGAGGGRGRGGDGAAQPGAGGGAGRGAPGGGRGGDGGRGAGAAPAAPAAPSQPPVDLRLTGVDMSPWRNMFVEVEGTLGPRPTSGLREFQVSSARSAYGECR